LQGHNFYRGLPSEGDSDLLCAKLKNVGPQFSSRP
jgi:hypothetical protein